VENGRNLPSKPDLTVMIGLYGATPEQHEELEDLRNAARSRGWWSAYRLPSWLHNYVGLEADATRIRNFEVELIPGLLQIPEYAREVHSLGPAVLAPEDIELKVAARMKRQELLTGPNAVTYHAIISEAALHRVKCTEYADQQYRRLLDMTERPNITILVLPFATRVHSMAGGFIILDFAAEISSSIAYFDNVPGGQLIHDSRDVAQLSDVYDELARQALSVEDTVAFITEWLTPR